VSPKNLYGVVAVLLAGLIISSSLGAYYYYQYGQQSQIANHYVSDLSDSATQYNQMVTQYNSALGLYNQTFALLAGTVGAVNTSLPIYAQASSQLSGLWSSYLKLKPQSTHVYSADILLNFGNGTRLWYNNSQIQPGWNLFTATVVMTRGNMQATWYPTFGEHLVNAIDGLSGTKTNYWIVWTYNSTALWQKAQVGADLIPVNNGSVLAWTYCGQTCKP
jgi:hypothetical protein